MTSSIDVLPEGNHFAIKDRKREHNVSQHCWMFLNNVKRVEPSPLPPRIIVLPLASNGGLLHMFADWPASGHAGWALADVQVDGRGAESLALE